MGQCFLRKRNGMELATPSTDITYSTMTGVSDMCEQRFTLPFDADSHMFLTVAAEPVPDDSQQCLSMGQLWDGKLLGARKDYDGTFYFRMRSDQWGPVFYLPDQTIGSKQKQYYIALPIPQNPVKETFPYGVFVAYPNAMVMRADFPRDCPQVSYTFPVNFAPKRILATEIKSGDDIAFLSFGYIMWDGVIIRQSELAPRPYGTLRCTVTPPCEITYTSNSITLSKNSNTDNHYVSTLYIFITD